MIIEAFEVQGSVPVTVLQPHGDLDGSTYRYLIDKAQEVYDAGARDILLDLSHVPYTSSSGLVAIHTIVLMLRGEKPPDPEYGWGAVHAIDRDIDGGFQQHLKLLNPQPKVDKVLETTGFKLFLEVYTDLTAAVASFQNGG
jgi:anti-anti-sigma regulatory factor